MAKKTKTDSPAKPATDTAGGAPAAVTAPATAAPAADETVDLDACMEVGKQFADKDYGDRQGKMAALKAFLWNDRKKLRVRFLDGDPKTQHAKVKKYAQQWMKYANIRFEFGNDPGAEIRISFKRRGHWSYVGKYALSPTIKKNEPTMNLQLRPTSSESEYSRVTLHEFGHALGCIHEHQHPLQNIPWDKEAVYAYYAQPPNSWSRADVDDNLFGRYSTQETQFSQFDRGSIMLYPIPVEHITDPSFAVGWNTTLSATDKAFIKTLYP